jgi:3',5'-cyclic AMP phosphodiesterase CpdA
MRRLLHISDLHVRVAPYPAGSSAEVSALLAATIALSDPELVVVSGDLAHRGRPEELAAARTCLATAGLPFLAVPGNHDIPHSPARFVNPWAAFEDVFGAARPSLLAPGLAVAGLNSVRPWRHQGGILRPSERAHAEEVFARASEDALRVAVCHHHLTGAPWRAARKFPLKRRDSALAELRSSGAEIVLGGHIHQATAVSPLDFAADASGDTAFPVLVTAPGFSRPRPHRTGETQGAQLIAWDDTRIVVEVLLVGAGGKVVRGASRTFARSDVWTTGR